MPKFNRQNKKKINPRYFLNETVEKQELNERPRDRSDRRGPSVKRKYEDHVAMKSCNAGKHCNGIEDWVERMGATGYYEGGKKIADISNKAATIKQYSDAIAPPDGIESWDSYFGTDPFSVKNYSDMELKQPGSPLDKLLVVLIRRGVRKAQKSDPNRGTWNDDDPKSKVGAFVDARKK